MTTGATEEIQRGERFAFGKNWARFLSVLSEERIRDAESSLRAMLELDDLRGKSFLDAGSGSGLFSLAARRLGASVSSFDYDPQSVNCARELRTPYFPDDANWRIEEGSVLDAAYLTAKGQFDVVYSWGVLHHTGDMWRALANVSTSVAPGGQLLIAIYNDQGARSVWWRRVKQLYCSGFTGKLLVCSVFLPVFVGGGALRDVFRRRNPLARYVRPTTRGMSTFYDWFDWLGGLPFEVATPEAIVGFYEKRGFALSKMVTVGGRLGNNEFVFRKADD
jgi:2-polyprenyl-6-hydroxyphenyl methylase/3-demethylubiquinone-9 3-methyltransferase